ncbi:MAG TPA: hypothetical protein VF077_06190 [Nitrospiraceae bacterium]
MEWLNLWEAMGALAAFHPTPGKREQIENIQVALGQCGQYGQEISIAADTDKQEWVIKVHSCFSGMEAVIRIPASISKPITVEDRRDQFGN